MSGSASAFAIVGRVTAVASGVGQSLGNIAKLLSGGLMAFGSSGVVTIGGFQLQGFEVPAKINFGGAQQMTLHKFPGGGRTIDVMGRDDVPVAWAGRFLGANAAPRARALNAMKNAGTLVTLTFDAFNFRVVIKQFTADYQFIGDIPYKISCEILYDNTASDTASASQDTTGSAITDLSNGLTAISNGLQTAVSYGQATLNAVTGIVTPITNALGVSVPLLGQASLALSNAQVLSSAVGGLAAGTQALSGSINAMQTADSVVASGLSTMETTFTGVVSRAASVVGGIVSGPADLAAAIDASNGQCTLVDAGSLNGRAMANASVGQA